MANLLNNRFYCVLLLVLAIIFCTGGVLQASETSMKDINSNPQKFSGKELTISEKVLSPITLIKMDVTNVDLKKANSIQSEGTIEINLYLLNDGTDNIFFVTHKILEKDSSAQFKAKLLTTSNDVIDSKAVRTFDKFVYSGYKMTAPDLSETNLYRLVVAMQKYEPWVLLVDAE